MRALGLMSGTSMDGVDACLMETDGIAAGIALESRFRPYSADERRVLAAAQGRWPEDGGLEEAHQVVLAAHAEVARAFCGVDLVGFHGQTLAHDPARGKTHQLGNGAALAKRLALPVAWDFRSADMRAGGQGAPLAPFYHHALVRSAGMRAPVAILNLGGVGNLTLVDGAAPAPEAPGALLAFDTGPGGALLDDFIQIRLGQPYDTDGACAAAGTPAQALIREALALPYFAAPPPKSLDRAAFAPLMRKLEPMRTEDGAATLTALTAASVKAATRHLPHLPTRWLICGGGRRNRAIMQGLSQALGAPMDPVETLGWDGDMLEAQAFAWLAARVARGLALSAPGTTGTDRPMPGGQLSNPPVVAKPS